MDENLIDRGDEKTFKKALLNRYLEDQVLYNQHSESVLSSKSSVSIDEALEYKEVPAKQANDVIVKINDEITSADLQNPAMNLTEKDEWRKSLPERGGYEDGNNQLHAVNSKLSKSLDVDQFKALYLDIPHHGEKSTVNTKPRKRKDLKRPQLHRRKYSDCSNDWTKSFQLSGRKNSTETNSCDVHDHPTNTLARGILKKISLPCSMPGAMERQLGRTQILSLSSLESSINELNGFDSHRASMSSFKSSCGSFPEVEFGDSDFGNRSTASSPPCSPPNGTSRFPPINHEVNHQ